MRTSDLSGDPTSAGGTPDHPTGDADSDDGHAGGDAVDVVDVVDTARTQWAATMPDLDTAPLGVIGRLGRVRSHIDARLDGFFADHGLNRQSWDVLTSLRRVGDPYRLTPTELYRDLMRTSGAVTHTLRGLETAGLVERLPNPSDRRSLIVGLTGAGKALVERIVPEHLAHERRLLAPLSEPERDTLAGLLRRLLLVLDNDPRAR